MTYTGRHRDPKPFVCDMPQDVEGLYAGTRSGIGVTIAAAVDGRMLMFNVPKTHHLTHLHRTIGDHLREQS